MQITIIHPPMGASENSFSGDIVRPPPPAPSWEGDTPISPITP